jgi:hypothetical protein
VDETALRSLDDVDTGSDGRDRDRHLGTRDGRNSGALVDDVRGERATLDPTQISLAGTFSCQLVLGVLGVLVMSSEHATGTIPSSRRRCRRRCRTR